MAGMATPPGPGGCATGDRKFTALLVVTFDELVRTIAFEVAGEQQGRMRGIGVVLGVQADVAGDVVEPAVAVEISAGE